MTLLFIHWQNKKEIPHPLFKKHQYNTANINCEREEEKRVLFTPFKDCKEHNGRNIQRVNSRIKEQVVVNERKCTSSAKCEIPKKDILVVLLLRIFKDSFFAAFKNQRNAWNCVKQGHEDRKINLRILRWKKINDKKKVPNLQLTSIFSSS